ncbi:MAG: hypothetical protein CSA86_04315 [Arcobacter sp.]|nr:MAG: hypothetical protein CSA86_04315 [Arcobacter sp.]
MDYGQIFMYGWGLNILMFFVNLSIALNVLKSTDIITMSKEHEVLAQLKLEIDKYYPNRGYETLISYFIPFVAFYKVTWRIIEMVLFFRKNQNARMFDFMVYRYQKEIAIAKNDTNS